jgi:hypothetical protein
VYISSFYDRNQEILNKDEIVIGDEEIKIRFNYPLEKEWFFNFSSKNGFTREKLLKSIVDKYHEIYKEEEETSSLSKDDKKEANHDDTSKEGVNYDDRNKKEESSENTSKSDESEKNTDKMEEFNSNGKSNFSIEKLILKLLSDSPDGVFALNRKKSNGKYGIWGHCIEDLVIERITYNKNNKIVYMFIGS